MKGKDARDAHRSRQIRNFALVCAAEMLSGRREGATISAAQAVCFDQSLFALSVSTRVHLWRNN
jgi:hypothetical protein